MMDFVLPLNNETEFAEMAKILGYTELCFVYNLKDYKINKLNIKTSSGILTQKEFDKAKQKTTMIITRAEENVRSIIEQKKANYIYGFEDNIRRDFIHYRNSGLNQVLCTLMKEKDIKYMITLNSILQTQDPQTLGRIIQNIRLCNKYKIEVCFASLAKTPLEMKAAKDVSALIKILGNQNIKSVE